MTTTWHGWETPQGVRLYIGRLPRNKNLCLYRQDGATIAVLARFISEELAFDAARLLDALIPKQFPPKHIEEPTEHDRRFSRLG